MITYSIVLFTILGVLDGCDEPVIALFALLGIGIHTFVAIYSFFPHEKGEKEKEKLQEHQVIESEDQGISLSSRREVLNPLDKTQKDETIQGVDL